MEEYHKNNLGTHELTDGFCNLSSLTLAFMGDAVYEIMVRKELIKNHPNLTVSKLNILSAEKVRASAQSSAYDYIKSKLTEKEYVVMKRGRNNNTTRCPKSCNPIEYHKATGLESLFGYLFLNQEYDRLGVIFNDVFRFLSES